MAQTKQTVAVKPAVAAKKPAIKSVPAEAPVKEAKKAPAKVAEKENGARSALYDKKIVHVTPIDEARRAPAEGSEPTATYLRYKLYKTGKTVRDFLEAGGRMVDVNWDVKHGFIKLG